VTGASRCIGIGCAIAARLLADGAHVMLHFWTPHDAEQSWGADPAVLNAVFDALGGPGSRLDHVAVDLADPDIQAVLVDRTIAVRRVGYSRDQPNSSMWFSNKLVEITVLCRCP
jgi:3-oxoacyl-[acyl-carrier protein] reductase